MNSRRIKTISVIEVEELSLRLYDYFFGWNEPIPSFDTRYEGILESCISQPFQQFNKKDLYPGLVKKASILFYLMIKNHPFVNGNKRIAILTVLFFLHKNNKWLYSINEELYRLAKKVANSKSKRKDAVIDGIESFIYKYIGKRDLGLKGYYSHLLDKK